MVCRDYYGCREMPGFSLPGAEHSTITSWNKEREADAYRNILTKVSFSCSVSHLHYESFPFQFPTGIVACVSDSYDIW